MSEQQIWSRNGVSLWWRADCYGAPLRALYAGRLNVGHLSYSDEWRDGLPWGAWLMTDEDGERIGWFETEQEAKDALVDRALKEMLRDG